MECTSATCGRVVSREAGRTAAGISGPDFGRDARLSSVSNSHRPAGCPPDPAARAWDRCRVSLSDPDSPTAGVFAARLEGGTNSPGPGPLPGVALTGHSTPPQPRV